MIILGIDPGKTGGLALVQVAGESVRIIDGTMTPLRKAGGKYTMDFLEAKKWVDQHMEGWGIVYRAVVEEVGSRPKQGVASTFQFGRVYGVAEALAAECSNGDVEYVRPEVWKKHFHLGQNKSSSIWTAEKIFGEETKYEVFPLKKHNGVAEAALIAYWWIQNNRKGN